MRSVIPILCGAALLLLPALPGHAQQVSGTIHTMWLDPADPDRQPVALPTLVTDDGRLLRLDMPAALLAAHGGTAGLDGRRVTLRLDAGGSPDLAAVDARDMDVRVSAIERVQGAPRFERDLRLAPAGAGSAAAVRMPYATLLCHYADSPDLEGRPKSYYERIMSDEYPSVPHYWSHVSGGRLSLSGSRVYGPYVLPWTHAQYHPWDPGSPMDNKIVQDCMDAADDDVYFPDFEGVIVQVNSTVGFYGGVAFSTALPRDGIAKSYKVALMAEGASPSMYAHEIGHNLGLPHSSGPYGLEYDSKWDVMSSGAWLAPGTTTEWHGTHTIGYHVDRLGWIPAHRRHVAPAGESTAILDPIDGGGSGANPQIAVIALPNHQFYTVEARQRTNPYSSPVPADAVLIHRISVPGAYGAAKVVDVDGNFDPNDEGAAWRVGETFRDRQNGVEVTVDAAIGGSFRVTIRTGAMDSIYVVPAAHRREVPFGAAAEIRDSAFIRITGPNAAAIPWSASVREGYHGTVVEAGAGTGSGWLRWRREAPDYLAPGTYVVPLVVTATGAQERYQSSWVMDTLTVTAPAGLVAGLDEIPLPDSVLVEQRKRDNWTIADCTATLRITGPGAQAAAWAVVRRPAWLTPDQSSGTGDECLSTTRSAIGMTPGSYADTVRIDVQGAERPVVWVQRMHVLAPLEIVPQRASLSASVPQSTLSAMDSVYVELRGDWAADALLRVEHSSAYLRIEDQTVTGSGWIRFRRRTIGLAPGTYPGQLRLVLDLDRQRQHVVTVADTVHVLAAPAALVPSATSVRDSAWVGEWSEARVYVQPQGEGSETRTWSIDAGPRNSPLSHVEGPVAGAGWVRWVRRLGERQQGLNVDTIRIRFVQAPHAEVLVLDSTWVMGGTQVVPLVITSAATRPAAQVGAMYVDTLQASGGVGARRWLLTSGSLPTGFTLDSITGVISGSTQQSGSFGFTVQLRAGDQTATAPFTLSVAWGELVILSAASRPAALMGADYADSLAAGGAGPDLRWHLMAGSLPTGLRLDSISGRVSGIAEAAGSFGYTVEARSNARTATRAFELTVGRPALQPSAILDQLLGGGSLTPDQVRFLDLLGNRNARLDVGDVRAWLVENAHLSAAETAELRSLLREEVPEVQHPDPAETGDDSTIPMTAHPRGGSDA
jgi:M6 family metalloprotease-like protein